MLNLKHYAGNFRKIMEQKLQLIFEVEPEDLANITESPEFPSFGTGLEQEKELKVRLDKWLWAARFFKTRALARSAVEHGKVLYDNQKTIPSKEIEVGSTILISQGKTKKSVIIRRLSTRRRSNDEANALFEILEIGPEHHHMDTSLLDNKQPRKMVRFLRRSLPAEESPK
jgi:ribosomal 50S subunit-recycling heat shock protein